MSYLGNLTLRLAAGAMQLPEEFRLRHAGFLAASQRDDGGFAGRRGQSDLYYTGFALRGLTLMGALTDEAAQRAAHFLRANLSHDLPAVDFLSLVFSSVLVELSHGQDVFGQAGVDRRATVCERLTPLRRDDGGFAKTPASGRSSTYQTFLSVACLQLIGAEIDQPERIAAMVHSRLRSDGGFAELDLIASSGTNPTAAAVGLLRLLEATDPSTQPSWDAAVSARFLAATQTADGGLRANTRIPMGDLLSTCTGLIALADLDGLDAIDLERAQSFIDSMEAPGGGFRGGGWDSEVDAEYTFYGLAARALLATVGK